MMLLLVDRVTYTLDPPPSMVERLDYRAIEESKELCCLGFNTAGRVSQSKQTRGDGSDFLLPKLCVLK